MGVVFGVGIVTYINMLYCTKIMCITALDLVFTIFLSLDLQRLDIESKL